MVFSSIEFLFAFLPAALVLYFVAPLRFRNAVLLLASVVFYVWGAGYYEVVTEHDDAQVVEPSLRDVATVENGDPPVIILGRDLSRSGTGRELTLIVAQLMARILGGFHLAQRLGAGSRRPRSEP